MTCEIIDTEEGARGVACGSTESWDWSLRKRNNELKIAGNSGHERRT